MKNSPVPISLSSFLCVIALFQSVAQELTVRVGTQGIWFSWPQEWRELDLQVRTDLGSESPWSHTFSRTLLVDGQIRMHLPTSDHQQFFRLAECDLDLCLIERSTVLDLQEAMNNGELSSLELVRMCLDRIAAYDKQGPTINAVLSLNPQAMDIALALDEERASSGARSALHGIPVVVKDTFNTPDLPTTAGARALADWLPPDDAFVVRKLREAGAVILGKSNMPDFAETGLCVRTSHRGWSLADCGGTGPGNGWRQLHDGARTTVIPDASLPACRVGETASQGQGRSERVSPWESRAQFDGCGRSGGVGVLTNKREGPVAVSKSLNKIGFHESKAAEGCRTPKPGGSTKRLESREASWRRLRQGYGVPRCGAPAPLWSIWHGERLPLVTRNAGLTDRTYRNELVEPGTG